MKRRKRQKRTRVSKRRYVAYNRRRHTKRRARKAHNPVAFAKFVKKHKGLVNRYGIRGASRKIVAMYRKQR